MTPPRRWPDLGISAPVVIIGGGIAGLCVAIALSRKGYSVIVAEKRADTVESGAGLQLSPNASHILMQWGLGPALARNAVAPTELAIRRWGEPRAYARMPMNSAKQGKGLASDNQPFWVVLRADLHRALIDMARREPLITIKAGWDLQQMRDDGAMVSLRFKGSPYDPEAGPRDIKALCVIGADGQRSVVRKLLGDARDLDRPGWEAWRTLIPADRTPDFIRAATTNLWLGRDSHAVHYPVAAGQLINLVIIKRGTGPDEGWNRKGDPAALADIRASAAPTLRDLMDQAPDWSVWTLLDRSPSHWLAKGVVALAGDAAHPVLPFLAQGAAMAIEDAAVLGSLMPAAEHSGRASIEKAFKAYAAQRSSRVHSVYKAARANARNYHLLPLLAWFRDRRMAQLGPEGMRRRYNWLYDWRMPE
ncbi:MAG: FAD-dependent oxidoreductase [Beijerinckiaceae bacterium]